MVDYKNISDLGHIHIFHYAYYFMSWYSMLLPITLILQCYYQVILVNTLLVILLVYCRLILYDILYLCVIIFMLMCLLVLKCYLILLCVVFVSLWQTTVAVVVVVGKIHVEITQNMHWRQFYQYFHAVIISAVVKKCRSD